jgi:hypothetical protein
MRLGTGLQLWNVNNGNPNGPNNNNNNEDTFWTVEDLGGAGSVVRSNGGKREVWILAEDAGSNVAALAASLGARERALRDLDACRGSSSSSPATIGDIDKDDDTLAARERARDLDAREAALAAREHAADAKTMRESDRASWEKELAAREAAKAEAKAAADAEDRVLQRRRELDAADRQREADEMRRLRERAEEMEQREREVVRRERWVVEAMRKISDRSR